jgi:hypothetical protein
VSRRRRAIFGALFVGILVVSALVAGIVRRWPSSPGGVPPGLVPASWETFRTSPGHRKHVGRDDVACKDCHDYEREGFKNPGAAPCARCHEKQALHAHKGNAERKTDCLTCHVFAPDRDAPRCLGCHKEPEGQLAAVKTHATTECATCHKMHDPEAAAKHDCGGSCHEQRATKHTERPTSKGCADCHKPHTPAAVAVTQCKTCHREPSGDRPAGHDSCIGCHQPHDFVAHGPVACVRCHSEKATLGVRREGALALLSTRDRQASVAHGPCTSCHTPHAPAKAGSACQACHADVRVEHGTKGACTECHDPHPADARRIVRPCTSCHTVARPDAAAHAGHVACATCHRPHDFPPPRGTAICSRCHEIESALTVKSSGHKDCTSCHTKGAAHDPKPAPDCGTCHAAEASSAPAGHKACQGCHDPHSGERKATCATCHEGRTHGPHEKVGGGCQTCHAPHGPNGPRKPPSCNTCHVPAQLPSLHGVAAHAVCTTCHTSHGPPRSDRATCTSTCHANRRDHQPQAAVCTGCHVFRRGP